MQENLVNIRIMDDAASERVDNVDQNVPFHSIKKQKKPRPQS